MSQILLLQFAIIRYFILGHKLTCKYLLSNYVADFHSCFSFRYFVSKSCSRYAHQILIQFSLVQSNLLQRYY